MSRSLRLRAAGLFAACYGTGSMHIIVYYRYSTTQSLQSERKPMHAAKHLLRSVLSFCRARPLDLYTLLDVVFSRQGRIQKQCSAYSILYCTCVDFRLPTFLAISLKFVYKFLVRRCAFLTAKRFVIRTLASWERGEAARALPAKYSPPPFKMIAFFFFRLSVLDEPLHPPRTAVSRSYGPAHFFPSLYITARRAAVPGFFGLRFFW